MRGLSDPVVIGVVVAPHGVRGTLKVKVLGSGRHLRRGIEPIVKGERRRILTAREVPKGFLIDLQGIGNRESAAGLRGVELLLDRAELDTPEAEEFYVGDLVDLAVYDDTGKHVGSVVDLLETPAHEILVVRDDGSGDERYVPFTFEHVPTVDPKRGRIVVSLLETSPG
ncbi:MAG TPA: ribosome maturation factor RimM [Rubrobacteraceae bacterium]|nr:ribosome maturation factor RimM [Rubrobacteraceae bacterium]